MNNNTKDDKMKLLKWFKELGVVGKVITSVVSVFILLIVAASVSLMFESDEEKAERAEKTEQQEKERKEDKEQKEVEKAKAKDEDDKQKGSEEPEEQEEAPGPEHKEVKGKQTFEVNEKTELGNIKIELQNVYVEDNELSFGFWWSHWASNDKVHFSYFAYLAVYQNGEELEQQDDRDTLLRQTEKGVDSRVDLTYKLQDDSPIEIKFKATSDEPEEQKIEVDIK